MNYFIHIINALSYSIGQAIVFKSTYQKFYKSDINISLSRNASLSES